MCFKLNLLETDMAYKSKEAGLEINKTKLNRTERKKLEYVNEYVYLGHIIALSNQMEKKSTKELLVVGKSTCLSKKS